MPRDETPLPTSRPLLWRTLAAVLLVGLGCARAAYLTSDAAPNLAQDEAHYWDWSRHLDWSYYSKGPLVAYLIRGGCGLLGTNELGVRGPAVLCGVLLLAGLYVLTVQVFRSDRLAFLAVVVGATLPPLTAAGLLMTIDAPFTCLWVWASVFGHAALVRGRSWAYPATGLLIALGILAKYTMVLWAGSAVLFLAATPGLRHRLFEARFWGMAAVAALGWVPVVVWNSQHDWVTFAHVGGQAGVNGGGVRWLGPLEYLGGQVALLLAGWFAVWVASLWAFRPDGPRADDGVRYLWWLSLPTFAFFGLFSLKTKVQLNWPVTAYLTGFLLTLAWLAGNITHPTRTRRTLAQGFLVTAAAVGLGLTLIVLDFAAVRPRLARFAGEPTEKQPFPIRRVDPTARLRGWAHLGREVDRARGELRRRGVADPVIVSTPWTMPGLIGFYCEDHPPVYSLGRCMGDRHSQYDLWRPNPIDDEGEFAGRPFLFVGPTGGVLIEAFALAFDRVEKVGEVTHSEQGYPMARWGLWVGHNFRGFPAGLRPNEHRKY